MPPAESASHWRLGASHTAHKTSTYSRPDRGWARLLISRTCAGDDPCAETTICDQSARTQRLRVALDQETLRATPETMGMLEAALGQRVRLELQGQVAHTRLRHSTTAHEAQHQSSDRRLHAAPPHPDSMGAGLHRAPIRQSLQSITILALKS